MPRSNFSKCVSIAAVLILTGCATAPTHINDVCAVFEQNDGWLNNWQRDASKAEAKYGVPMHILMATVRKESGFKANARPPRKWYLGFIPGKRASTAYGYSQALNGTWAEYVAATNNYGARRTNFADAVDFVGWYHSRSAEKLGIAKSDAYNLYLAYYSGWGGYQRGVYRSNGIMNYAKATKDMADKYEYQLRTCRT